MPEKNTDDPREEITEDPEEEPITDGSKRILYLRNLKRILSLKTLRGFRTLIDFCAAKKTFFGFLIMVYDRLGDGNNFPYENFGIAVTLKLKL